MKLNATQSPAEGAGTGVSISRNLKLPMRYFTKYIANITVRHQFCSVAKNNAPDVFLIYVHNNLFNYQNTMRSSRILFLHYSYTYNGYYASVSAAATSLNARRSNIITLHTRGISNSGSNFARNKKCRHNVPICSQVSRQCLLIDATYCCYSSLISADVRLAGTLAKSRHICHAGTN